MKVFVFPISFFRVHVFLDMSSIFVYNGEFLTLILYHVQIFVGVFIPPDVLFAFKFRKMGLYMTDLVVLFCF